MDLKHLVFILALLIGLFFTDSILAQDQNQKKNQKGLNRFLGTKREYAGMVRPPKILTQPVAKNPAPTEIPTPEKLETLHKKEDEVLVENKLPKPTSENHERIRKMVQEHLKSKKDNEPIELAPLYFILGEDEFSVVDMEPFLVAVEYALQGKIVLIEGHTDSQGDASYNNQLSIKRVQKIRQLMHDMGVDDEHISIVGYGEGAPKHDNTSETARQLNRRVDFKVF